MSKNSLIPSRMSRPVFRVSRQAIFFCLTRLIARAYAADLQPKNCSLEDDTYLNNSRSSSIASWVSRGICVRSNNVEHTCYESFDFIQRNLDTLRAGEYAGAASVLALLPTIGALLGAPTSEIWRLLAVVPFGGGLAMTLSFGGAIFPVRVEDYESDMSKNKVAIERTIDSRAEGSRQSEDVQREIYAGLDQVVEKILRHMRQDESQQLAKGYIWVGLFGMIVLSVGAQAAMVVVEQGGIIPWWCVSRCWMHLWYILVTFTAFAENWAQVPFKKSWKLFVSDVPYDVKIQGGDSILPNLEIPGARARHLLHQLASLRMGKVTLHGSTQYTRPRNAVLVMVSVAIQAQGRYTMLWRLSSKCLSIAAFVTGTALFASVRLLSMPVAVMTLTLILAAGIFGRAITAWIISGVGRTEPLIHVIVNTNQEAQHVIARILSLDDYGTQESHGSEVRKIQVELRGHVIVSQRRVGHRSRWYLTFFGILAEPFDLRKVHLSESHSPAFQANGAHSEVELGLLRE